MRFFDVSISRGVNVSTFSRDRLITGAIGCRLEDNCPNSLVDLLPVF